MGEFLLAVAVIIVAAFVFAVWLCAKVIGLIIRAFAGVAKPQRRRALAPVSAPWRADNVPCAEARCLAVNPPQARFCRRCGRAVSAKTAGAPDPRPPMRYVA